jgi:hypothetical protein
MLIAMNLFVFSNSIGKDSKSAKVVKSVKAAKSKSDSNSKTESNSKIENDLKELKNVNNERLKDINDLKKANDSLFQEINGIKNHDIKVFQPNYISISVDLLILVLIIAAFIKLNTRLSRQRNEIEKIKDNLLSSAQNRTNSSHNTDDRYSHSINLLKKEMSEITAEFSRIKQPADKKSTKDTYQQKAEVDRNVVVFNEASKEFFMGVPYENSFTVNSKSETYLLGKAMYKFLIGNTQSEADFEFISDSETIKYIQNNNLEIVRPACVLENSPTQNTIKVVTVKKGKARFQEDKWVIIEKAKIRFE